MSETRKVANMDVEHIFHIKGLQGYGWTIEQSGFFRVTTYSEDNQIIDAFALHTREALEELFAKTFPEDLP